MAAIFFADLDALRLALTSGAVPPAISRAPARAGFDAQGRLWLQPSPPLARETIAALTRLGAIVQGTSGAELTEEVECWPQLLPLKPAPLDPHTGSIGPVLFVVSDATHVPAFVAELRRLGASGIGIRWTKRQERATDDLLSALIHVASAPPFSLLRALDRGPESPRGFLRQTARVWVEIGFQHPLAKQIEAPPGKIALLVAPRFWDFVDDGPFRSGPDQFLLPYQNAAGAAEPNGDRISLSLRLIAGRSNEPAEFWIIADEPMTQLRTIVEQSDNSLVSRLLFAMGEFGGRRVVALRARRGHGGPPVLVLDALACHSYLRLPNLFVPVGMRLRPPLRRDAVRRLLAADDAVVYWLAPGERNVLQRHALPVTAFRPLNEFVSYRLDHEPGMASEWVEKNSFVLPAFTVEDLRPTSRRPTRSPAVSASETPAPIVARSTANIPTGWWHRLIGRLFTGRPDKKVGRSPLPIGRVGPAARTPASDATSAPPRLADDTEDRRRALEARLLAAANSADDAERRALWPDLATLYAAQNRPRDAAVCWLNALWEDDAPQPQWARGWLRAESRAADGETDLTDLDRWISGTPNSAAIRATAAFIVWTVAQNTASPVALATGPQMSGLLDRVQRLLDAHEHWLPVRAAWLARLALARLTNGDVVGLARARDRLMERMHDRGLSADLDVPTFLRFAGQASGEQVETVREWLLHAHEPIHRWIAVRPQRQDSPAADSSAAHDPNLRRFGLSTDLRSTGAYADLILAWGLARLGERAACRDMLTRARTVLAGPDDVHAFLLEAFAFRVLQALDGRPESGPLPPELLARLQAMQRQHEATGSREESLSFRVEMLRRYSRILEPAERIDVYHETVLRGQLDDLRRELAGLRGVTDRAELTRKLHQLLTMAGRDPDRLPRVLETALDLAPRVGESFATNMLDRLLATVGGFGFAGRPEQIETQVLALERGLFVAAHFDHATTVQRLIGHLDRLFDPRRGDDATTGPSHAEDAQLALIGQSLRSLRRLGLRAEADLLLDRLGEWVAPSGDLEAALRRRPQDRPKTLRRLLTLAGGWFYVGRDAPATMTFDAARQLLFAGELRPPEQTTFACAYATALGQAPVQLALERVDELFQHLHGVTDTQTTNTHFSVSRLRLVEAAVCAIVNDDFALGPAVRRWLDDDEYRVRRRIHRNTRAAVGPGL